MLLMKHLGAGLVAALLVAAASLSLSLPSASAQLSAITPKQPNSSGQCSRTWEVLPSPNTGNMGSYLSGVSAISGDDVWAAGYSYTWNAGYQAQVQHWNGNTWSLTPDPEGYARSYDIEALPSGDVWLVGQRGGQALIDRWDGAQWEPIPHPNPGAYSNTLYGIAALSSNDIWAVGDYTDSYGVLHGTLVERWDGTQWSLVPSPNAGTGGSHLFDIAAVSSDNAWAVGYYYDGNVQRTLIEHWDGTQWAIIPSPNVGTHINILNGVTIVAPNDVWAVGYYDNEWTTPDGMLIEHWDGTAWSVVAGPNLGSIINRLHDVISLAANDVWAVGEYGSVNDSATLIIHWDGSTWSLSPSPNMQGADTLYGIDVDSAGTLWTVGKYGYIDGERTLVARALDPCVTPSPTVTGTPPTATQTRTFIPSRTPTATRTRTPKHTATFTRVPPTATPSVTASVITSPTFTAIPPTACIITFTDVDESNIFYPFIRCLACRGIMTGYSDGTFRPHNDITRGQIAKSVSNAAGFDEDPGPQLYEDVPEGSPFYQWINRLSMRGHIGGYPCGLVPEEPCIEPDNLPYFRPSNSATRGQLSKIVANAAGLDATPSGQFYTDVQEDHPFYIWVMRLTELNVMGGYDCGGPGEPCDSEDRPYFRPYNNVTRGQASKIVANTFYPNCQTP